MRCENCKWWDPETNDQMFLKPAPGFGVCHALGAAYNHPHPGEPTYLETEDSHGRHILMVRASFGCVLHTPAAAEEADDG